MGQIADDMNNGKLCSICGVWLAPGEEVYLNQPANYMVSMPEDGTPYGMPVICQDCNDSI